MEIIQNICLANVLSNTILGSYYSKPYEFDWSVIGKHDSLFGPDYNYEDARILLQLSLMVTNANFRKVPLISPDWLLNIPLIYPECPIELISKGLSNSPLNKPSILGHVLYSERTNILFIVFTGTSNACMVGIDIQYVQVELTNILNYTKGLKGHRGIYTGYMNIRSQLTDIIKRYLPKNPKIVITGHSLGGALSGLCALDLAYYNPIHYSFATPMIFNQVGCEVFNRLVNNSYRISNMSDLVTIMPLPIMPNGNCFCHVGKSFSFQTNMGNYPNNHALAYVLQYNIPFVELDK